LALIVVASLGASTSTPATTHSLGLVHEQLGASAKGEPDGDGGHDAAMVADAGDGDEKVDEVLGDVDAERKKGRVKWQRPEI